MSAARRRPASAAEASLAHDLLTQVLAGLRWSDYESVSARTYTAKDVTPAVAVTTRAREAARPSRAGRV